MPVEMAADVLFLEWLCQLWTVILIPSLLIVCLSYVSSMFSYLSCQERIYEMPMSSTRFKVILSSGHVDLPAPMDCSHRKSCLHNAIEFK